MINITYEHYLNSVGSDIKPVAIDTFKYIGTQNGKPILIILSGDSAWSKSLTLLKAGNGIDRDKVAHKNVLTVSENKESKHLLSIKKPILIGNDDKYNYWLIAQELPFNNYDISDIVIRVGEDSWEGYLI